MPAEGDGVGVGDGDGGAVAHVRAGNGATPDADVDLLAACRALCTSGLGGDDSQAPKKEEEKDQESDPAKVSEEALKKKEEEQFEKTEDELRQFLSSSLAKHKIPATVWFRTEPIPRNANGASGWIMPL